MEVGFERRAGGLQKEPISRLDKQMNSRKVARLRTSFFPNSHAMGSCKTNRRTGAVGSPSELVGGWRPGHVLMASGSCDAGVPVMF